MRAASPGAAAAPRRGRRASASVSSPSQRRGRVEIGVRDARDLERGAREIAGRRRDQGSRSVRGGRACACRVAAAAAGRQAASAGSGGRSPATSSLVSLRDKAAIVGIGQLPFSKNIGRSEEVTALEASRLALEDAGLRPSQIDGMSKWSIQVTSENAIARNLGVPNLRWFGEVGYGGGGGCGVVGHAAAAIAAGMARCVLVYRSRNRGSGGRPWAGTSRERDQSQAEGNETAFFSPYGFVRPVDQVAMFARRFLHDRGYIDAAPRLDRGEHAQARAQQPGGDDARADDARGSRQLAHHLGPAAPVRQLPRDRRRGRGDRRRRGAGARLPAEAGVHPRRVAGDGAAQLHDEQLLQGARSSSHPARTRRATCGAWRAADRRTSTWRSSTTPSRRSSSPRSRSTASASRATRVASSRTAASRWAAIFPTTPAAAACRRRTCTAST